MSETLSGYVQAKERTKSGKAWKLKLNGKYISVSNRANMDGVDQGSFVEYELGGFQGDNGWVSTIDRVRPAKAPDGAQQERAYNGAAAGSSLPSRLANAAWDDSALRFISNVVGCALTAGHAKDPTDILAWTAAAEQALKNLGQAQAPTLGNKTSGPAPREPGSDDGDPGFDNDDALRF